MYGDRIGWRQVRRICVNIRFGLNEVILRIRWSQKTSTLEVRNICKQDDTKVDFTRMELWWTAHILKNVNKRKKVAFWTSGGKRKQERHQI